MAAALLLAAIAILIEAWTQARRAGRLAPRRPASRTRRPEGDARRSRGSCRLAARRGRAGGRAGGGDEADGAGDGGGAERRGHRPGAGGAALGGGGVVVRAGAGRRRLLVPAQPARRRQPAARGRAPRADLPAAPRAAAGRPPRLQHRPLRDRHRRLAPLLRARRCTRPSARSGRWSSSARRGGGLLALFAGRDRLVRWLGGVALFGLLAYLFTPLSAAGAEGEPVGFAINIRYVIPALLAALVLLPLPRFLDDRRRQWALLERSSLVLLVTDRPDAALHDTARLFALAFVIVSVAVPAACWLARARGGAAATASPAASPPWRSPRSRIGYPVQRHYLDAPLRQRRPADEQIPGHGPRLRLSLGARDRATPASAWPGPPPASPATASTAPTSPTGSSTSAKRAPTAPSTRSRPAQPSARPSTTPTSTTWSPRPSSTSSIPAARPLARGPLAARRRTPPAGPAQRPGHRLEDRRQRSTRRPAAPTNAPLREIPNTPS